MAYFYHWLKQKYGITALLMMNLLGTAYGFYWYKWQLINTPPIFRTFVPDSPTASLFFVIVLAAYLFKKHVPLFEALAVVTLFKYGVWAVGMNIAGGFVTGSLNFTSELLIFSHGCMAVEGLVFIPFYRIKPWHLALASLWVLHDLMIDYVFRMMPTYPPLADDRAIIGYATFWLTVFTIALVGYLTLRKNRFQLEI